MKKLSDFSELSNLKNKMVTHSNNILIENRINYLILKIKFLLQQLNSEHKDKYIAICSDKHHLTTIVSHKFVTYDKDDYKLFDKEFIEQNINTNFYSEPNNPIDDCIHRTIYLPLKIVDFITFENYLKNRIIEINNEIQKLKKERIL